MLEAHPFEHLETAAPLLRRRHAEHFEDERDVLEDRARRNELEVLEDESNPPPVFLDLAATELQ